MKLTIKQKLFTIIGFFLDFSFPIHFDPWKCLKKFLWVGGWLVFLNLVSSPGPDYAKVKARFGWVGE